MTDLVYPKIRDVKIRERIAIDAKQRPQKVYSIGLTLNEAPTIWGDCPYMSRTFEDVSHLTHTRIKPILMAQTLKDWKTFLEQIETDRGFDDTGEEDALLPRSLVIGIQLALLKSVAFAEDKPLPRIWRARKEKPIISTTAESVQSEVLFRKTDHVVASIPAMTDPDQLIARIGDDGQLLQKYIRDLSQWMAQHGADAGQQESLLIMHLNGNLDRLYGDRPGRVLGALIGLQNAVSPHRLVLIDLFARGDLAEEAHEKRYTDLRKMMRMRKVNIKLFDSTLAQVKDTAINGLVYDLGRTGGLSDLRNRLLNPMVSEQLIVRLPRVLTADSLEVLLSLLGGVFDIWLPNGLTSAVTAINAIEAAE